MTEKWNGMSNQQMDAVIMNEKCGASRIAATSGARPAQFYFELFSTWMSEEWNTTADNALELMVFDPTKTRVKSTVLHQLTDGNWFVSNADQQLVMSTSFEVNMQNVSERKSRDNEIDCTSRYNLCDSIADVMARVLLGI